METFLRAIVISFARMHSYILSLNDAYEQHLSDKELHFFVIGAVGMVLVLMIYPLFQWLSQDHVIWIVFIYVFTLILVLTFAIEIGQGYSGTGTMDFDDIVSGVMGFLLFFLVFAIARELILIVAELFRRIFRK